MGKEKTKTNKEIVWDKLKTVRTPYSNIFISSMDISSMYAHQIDIMFNITKDKSGVVSVKINKNR